jgi:hypothetical protein
MMYYGGIYGALMSTYNYNFFAWLFDHVPQHFWEDPENHRAYLDWICECLDMNTSEDWYKIQYEDLLNRRGGNISS